MNIQTFILIALSSLVFALSFRHKIKLNPGEWGMVLFMGIGYWFYIAWLPFTTDTYKPIIFSFLERKIAILILPLVVCLIMKLYKSVVIENLYWFVVGAVLKGLYVNGLILALLIQTNQFHINHVFYRDHFNLIGQIHPTYFGMYLVFAMVILWEFKSFFGKQYLWLHHLMQFFLFAFLLLLSPKAPLAAACVLIVLGIFTHERITGKLKSLLILGVVSLLILTWVFIPFFHDRMGEIIQYFVPSDANQSLNSVEIRGMILKSDFSLLKENWIIGYGPAVLDQKLNTMFILFSKYAGYSLGLYNTHNEFLNQWLCFGLPGILYFLALLFMHWKSFHY